MDVLGQIAEARIRDAIARGECENLEGTGRPLQLEDLSRMDPALRAGYLVLKAQGFAPEELTLRKEILKLEDLLGACGDGPLSGELRSDLARCRLRFELLVGRRADTAAREYEGKLFQAASREQERARP